jgi:ribosomal protein S18 acetylase RimI-like enzyme
MRVVANPMIRSATPADLKGAAALGAELVRLHHATNPNRFFLPEQPEEGYLFWLSKEIERAQAVVLVADIDGAIVGYAYGTIEERDWSVLVDRHGAINDVFIAASARRLGVGKALVLELIARLEQLGAPRILLRAMVQNESAQRLFASVGFRATMVEMTRERS